MSSIGLDFGTGNTVLSSMQGSRVQVFGDFEGSYGISSDVLVGTEGTIDTDPRNLLVPPRGFSRVTAIKRTLLTLPPDAQQQRQHLMGLAVARLGYLYERFSETSTEPILKAVLTCPANAGQAYRELLLEIGRRINLPEVDVVDEPTAAAIHHGLAEIAPSYERWLVVDWGCGTCDVSLIERRKGQADLEVKIVKGDNELGGMDMDVLLRAQLALKHGFRSEMCPLWQVEAVKKRLSEVEEVTETLVLEDGQKMPVVVTRVELETLVQPLLGRAEMLVASALKELHWGDVDQVIATGGPMLMPAVRRMLVRALDRDEDELLWRDPLTSVAQGAARLAELKRIGGLVVTNQVAQSIGVRVVEGQDDDAYHPVIRRGETRPISRTVTLATSVDLQDIITVEVREGDNRSAAGNTMLGRFNIVVRPEKKGEVKVKLGLRLSDAGAMETWVEAVGDPNTLRQVQKLVSVRVDRGSSEIAQAELRLGDPVEEFHTSVGEDAVDPDIARQRYERLKIKYHPDRDPARRGHWNARLAALDTAFEEYIAEVQRRIRATTLPDLAWDDSQALSNLKVDEVLAQRLVHCLAQGIGGEARQPALRALLKRYPDYRRVLASYLFAIRRNSVLQALLAQDDRPHVGLVVLLQNLPGKPIRERHEVLKAAYRLPQGRVRDMLSDPDLSVASLYTQVPIEAPAETSSFPSGSYGSQQGSQQGARTRARGGSVVSLSDGSTVWEMTLTYERDWTWVYGDVEGLEQYLRNNGFAYSRKRNAWYATQHISPSDLT